MIAKEEGFSVDRLEYNFVDRSTLLSLNRRHLKHDYHTDIITFDYTTSAVVSAELFISTWALKDSAKTFKTPLIDELLRVVFHGLLHCLQYDDKNPEQQAIIKEKENYCINMFHVKQLKHV